MINDIIDQALDQVGYRLSHIFYNIITRDMQDKITEATNYNRLHMNFRKSTGLGSNGMYFDIEHRYIIPEMCDHIDSP